MTKSQELVTRGRSSVTVMHPEEAAPSFSFQDMQRMAASIAKSGLFGVKDADQALALMLIAQAQGQHPALVARDFDIIQGRPAKKSEAILRDFQASGGKVEWHKLDDTCADATFTHPLSPKGVRIAWDMARAKQAGLVDKNGGMFVKFPRQMLRSRCVSEGCRTTAPQATGGYYTPEEVSQFDEDVPQTTTITAAVEQAATALTQDQIEALIDAMDVTTLPALEVAFGNAWRATKDPHARASFKSVYDGQKQEIERVAAEKASEQS